MSDETFSHGKSSSEEALRDLNNTLTPVVEADPAPVVDAVVIEEPKPEPEGEAGIEYQLVAVDGPQLVSAHGRMISWARAQVATMEAEKQAEEESLAIAVSRKWATAGLRRRVSMLGKRREFYEKIEQALLAGFVIVPNFEMNVFAIRTTKESPNHLRANVASWNANRSVGLRQPAETLPAGEGKFVNPNLYEYHSSYETKDSEGKKGVQHYRQSTGGFQNIDFPIVLAKPVVMSKSAEAMAQRVFDEIGVARDSGAEAHRGGRVGDPFVLGRCRNPRKNRPDITFFIGWLFDPTRL
jgi:hypothetical protein